MTILTDEEINVLVKEAAQGSAIKHDGSTSQRIARAIEQVVLEKLKQQRDVLLAALNLIEVDKDGDGFICREAMEQVREAIAHAEGADA